MCLCLSSPSEEDDVIRTELQEEVEDKDRGGDAAARLEAARPAVTELTKLLAKALPKLRVATKGVLDQELLDRLAKGLSSEFLEDVKGLVTRLEGHHQGQTDRLRAKGQRPGAGHFWLVCYPGMKAKFTGADPSLDEGALVLALLIQMYFPVANLAWEAPKGGRWCHTCLQLHGLLAPLLERMAQDLGRPVFVPIMDTVPCVASAVPESGQERLWETCRVASFEFIKGLLKEFQGLQLAVLSTKVYKGLLEHDDEERLFQALGDADPVISLERALSGGEDSITSAFMMALNTGGDSLALFASHLAAKLLAQERAAMLLAIGRLAVRAKESGASPTGLFALCADLLDAEGLGAAMGAVNGALEAVREAQPDAYLELLREYRNSPAEVRSRVEEGLRDGPPEKVAVLVQATGLVMGALTSERTRVALAVADQLKKQGTGKSLRQIIDLVEKGEDSERLGRYTLLHPDSTRRHLSKTIADMMATVKGWPSFTKHRGLRPSPARLEYFVIGLLIDTHNGSIGGAYLRVHPFLHPHPSEGPHDDDDGDDDDDSESLLLLRLPVRRAGRVRLQGGGLRGAQEERHRWR
jgi:hypothetical protein